MARRLTFTLLFVILCAGLIFILPLSPLKKEYEKNLEFIKKEDRILILAPHPDDEAIACAGIIQHALKVGAKLKIAYLTNGDHNELAFIVYEKRIVFRQGAFIHMGELRKKEAVKAMKLLGIPESELIFMGYPDFGTLRILSQYWQTSVPFRDILTHISSVPYKDDLSYGAPYVGESILNDLEKIIREYKPNKIFVSHPQDTNPDHKALYLFLQVALADLNREMRPPKIYPYLVHCPGWPKPRDYHPSLSLNPPDQFLSSDIKWSVFNLDPAQVANKYDAILCYRSQTASAAFYLLSFARRNEIFGDNPVIRLDKAASAKEKGISFFGFTGMYKDCNAASLESSACFIDSDDEVGYAVADGNLLIRIKKLKKLNINFNFQFLIFGYNSKIPFASMPKIRIVTWHKRLKVFDKGKVIDSGSLKVDLDSQALTLQVPLRLLGDPQFVLISVRGSANTLPYKSTGFRKIEIR